MNSNNKNPNKSIKLEKFVIGKTKAGMPIDVIKVWFGWHIKKKRSSNIRIMWNGKNKEGKDYPKQHKKSIIFMARQHPG